MEQTRSSWVKWLVALLVGFALSVGALFGTCVYVGMQGPDTKVLAGRQVPARFVDQIRGLGILDADERIEYFYSDALVNIENGLYLVTDRSVIVYSREFEEPAIITPLGDITGVDAEFSDDWIEDSIVTITLKDGSDVSFPVSMEGGGDHRVVDFIRNKIEQPENAEQ